MDRVHVRIALWLTAIIMGIAGTGSAEDWHIALSPSLKADAAVLAACEDITAYGESLGITFTLIEGTPPMPEGSNSLLLVGAEIMNQIGLEAAPHEDPQGFEIRTAGKEGRGRIMGVVGGSPIGDAYGLYWIWDRMRVQKRVPDINTMRAPKMRVRLTGGEDTQSLRDALRHTANWVSKTATMQLVPWDAEPEATENAKTRTALLPLIEEAHSYHMKFLVSGDDIAFHPSFIEEMGATLNPADPKLWDALQEKYRRLFTAMPQLDGIQMRTGELTRVGGNYVPFNVMHDGEAEDWPLDRRYRTFIQKVHEVVVGEFDKIYFHRTWATTADEQHSDPEVYKAIFTDEVPTKDLYLSPYMSLADRWYYQPYNPTFNQTPHNMLALLSILDYHAHGGVKIFPSFPGDYHQGGVQGVLADPDTNLKGFHFGIQKSFRKGNLATSNWSTLDCTAYTIFRLAWNPDEDLMAIARDYASIHVGPEAAQELGELLLLSQRVYTDGIYIKPVAEKIVGNTLPHLRLTNFRTRGIPQIDKGFNHVEWLRTTMYEPSRGKIGEAIEYLDSGLAAARELVARYEALEPTIADQEKATYIGDGARLALGLVETNNAYVKTAYAYFNYREDPTALHKAALAKRSSELKAACERFEALPNFVYKLGGIKQLLQSVDAALTNLAAAEADLAKGISEENIQDVIKEVQAAYAAAWENYGAQAKPLAHWQARIDGIDIVRMQGDVMSVEHIKHDGPQEVTPEARGTLPKQPVTVLLKPIRSNLDHPFILAQPTAANDYTVEIYCYNRPPGYDWWEFELYYLEQSPEELGLEIPWQ